MKLTCSKSYPDFPFAHRQHNHSGHCALIHGHNWTFDFTFQASELDENGFVVDFGGLKWLKEYLTEMFDHTLILNEDDPMLGYLVDSLKHTHQAAKASACLKGFADIRVLPNGGAEGIAAFLLDKVDGKISDATNGRVRVQSVTAREDSKNYATATR